MTNRENAIRALDNLLAETLPFFDEPPEKLNRTYAPGKWTMREVLIHLSDTETVLLDRLRRIAAEEKPSFYAFDQDRWAEKLDYKQRSLALAKTQFETARRAALELLRMMPAALDTRTGIHSEAGTRSFEQIFTMIHTHNAHHLEQIKACAAGTTWKAVK